MTFAILKLNELRRELKRANCAVELRVAFSQSRSEQREKGDVSKRV